MTVILSNINFIERNEDMFLDGFDIFINNPG